MDRPWGRRIFPTHVPIDLVGMMFPLFDIDPTLKVQVPRRFYMNDIFYSRVNLAVAIL